MTHPDDKSLLQRYPIEILVIAAIVLAALGTILMLTVAGAIIGLPLWGLAAILALIAGWKSRSREGEEGEMRH
jgi:hypothetical protein